MAFSIQFNSQFDLGRIKVEYIGTNAELSSKLAIENLPILYAGPHKRFTGGISERRFRRFPFSDSRLKSFVIA